VLAGEKAPPHVRRLDPAGIRGLAEIDATPIGQNSRSTPATYSGAFDAIRQAFADTPLARRRGWQPGHFSFNTKAGQCPECEGLGYIDIDVQYLPDIREVCPRCHGTRYLDEVLDVRLDELTISDVLGLTVHDAAERFAARPTIVRPLQPIDDVGLGYLRLGRRHRPCPAANRSGCASRHGCAAASATSFTSLTSRLPGCIRWTFARWSACSTDCSTAARPSS